ncbi:unnamed protein product [Linum trigynum]|uniref:Uncharacterized protein n=1 Tax=Linum trigynum TaxID=586398 RepID=A0AAV2GK52_9ROSI
MLEQQTSDDNFDGVEGERSDDVIVEQNEGTESGDEDKEADTNLEEILKKIFDQAKSSKKKATTVNEYEENDDSQQTTLDLAAPTQWKKNKNQDGSSTKLEAQHQTEAPTTENPAETAEKNQENSVPENVNQEANKKEYYKNHHGIIRKNYSNHELYTGT